MREQDAELHGTVGDWLQLECPDKIVDRLLPEPVATEPIGAISVSPGDVRILDDGVGEILRRLTGEGGEELARLRRVEADGQSGPGCELPDRCVGPSWLHELDGLAERRSRRLGLTDPSAGKGQGEEVRNLPLR